MLKKIADLFFPLQNIEYTSIDTYLTVQEINICKPRLKKIPKEDIKYIESIFVMSQYSYPLIHDLIHRTKYCGEIEICKALANALYQKIYIDSEIFIPNPDLIVPVPGDIIRLTQRGYNIPSEISKWLSVKTGVGYLNLLKKNHHTVAQNKLTRKERLLNVKDMFSIDKDLYHSISNKEIIWLIDDLSTTGTTLVQCAKAIKNIFPFIKIYGVVISSN
jgi:ComF family protein